MSTSLHSLALAALVAVTVGCSSPLTRSLARGFRTPRPPPREVRWRASASASSTTLPTPTIFDRTVTFNGARSIPGDVGVVANDPDEARRIHVVVTASFTGSAPVVREFSLRFQPRRTVVLDAWIDGGCRTRSTPCPQGYTCGHDALCEGVTDPRLSDLTPIVDAGRRVTDTALDVTNDLPTDATNDLPTDVANDLPRDVINDVPTDVLNDVPMDAPRDAVDDLPRDVRRAPTRSRRRPARPTWSSMSRWTFPCCLRSTPRGRLIAPLSTSTVTSRQPTFEWTGRDRRERVHAADLRRPDLLGGSFLPHHRDPAHDPGHVAVGAGHPFPGA